MSHITFVNEIRNGRYLNLTWPSIHKLKEVHIHVDKHGHIISDLSVEISLQLSVKNCFIRGSVVRYVQLPAEEVDTSLLQDATRKEAAQNKT